MFVKSVEYQLCTYKTDETEIKFMYYIYFFKQKTLNNFGVTYTLFLINTVYWTLHTFWKI